MARSSKMETAPASSSAPRSRGAMSGAGGTQRNKEKGQGSNRAADRRLAERVAVDIDVDYSSDETFLFANSANITNLSALGVFVRTTSPEPVGTKINLRFNVTGRSRPLILEGEVVWVNRVHDDGQDDLNPGMGVRFSNLALEQRETLVGLVRRLALLMDDE